MSEDDGAGSSASSLSHQSLEVHEEFIQHVERGQRKLRNLSIITLVVAVLLGAAYSSQILEPFVTGQKVVQVNLADPTLVAVELLVLILTLAWIYVGAVNYLFYTRLGKSIKEIRAKEDELLRRITG